MSSPIVGTSATMMFTRPCGCTVAAGLACPHYVDGSGRRVATDAINNDRELAAIVRPHVRAEQETFVAVYINVRNVPIGEPFVVAIGTVTDVDVHPRDIFREAVRRNAVGVICAHNHPSGDPAPSNADIIITEKLAAAGKMLEIPLVDHVIVTDTSHYSIHDNRPELFP